MSLDVVLALLIALLAIIALAAGSGVVIVLRASAAIGRRHEETHRVLSARDPGPALHALMQQVRDVNRQLASIEKRLEKLEALEKVQIATLSLRDGLRSGRG